MEEIWKDIKGYEGLYQVSNCGRVRNSKGRILKQRKDKYGYFVIKLCKNNKHKHFLVHRLVASTFISNPDNLPCVNHRNELKVDNRVENLEYCTVLYNNTYGTRLERVSNKKINGKKAKAVLQFSLDGTFIKEFPSVREVERQLGFFQSHISDCCRGNTRLKTYKGYIWKYKEVS